MTTADHEITLVANLLEILVSVSVVTLILQRVRLATIPAYLITGALLGPYALGVIRSSENLEEISHLAIILLLFGIGLEMRLSVLKHSLTRLILAGFGSCLASVFLGWPLVVWSGLSPPAALVICMGFSLSSTAVVLRILTERRELLWMSGRLTLSILVIQDMIVLGMLAMLPVLAEWGNAPGGPTTAGGVQEALGWPGFFLEVGIRIAGPALLILVGHVVLPRLLRESLRGRSLEVLLIVGVSIALATAYAAQAIGFSLEMGAFISGFVLAGTPFRNQLVGQIGPLRDLFIAVFFTTLGMKLDFAIMTQWWWVILFGGMIMTALKATVISGTCWSLGTTASTALAVGLSLAQAGEFSLILFDTAHDRGILTDTATSVSIAIVVISLIVTPALIKLGARLKKPAAKIGHAPWIRSPFLADSETGRDLPRESSLHVVIGGFGPIGRLLAEELERISASYTIVDLNVRTVEEETLRGRSIVFGDIGNANILESAGIGHADAIVLTVPDVEVVKRACAIARATEPGIYIAARAGTTNMVESVRDSGADHVTVDESAAAESILRTVLDRLGSGQESEADFVRSEELEGRQGG